MSSNLILVAVSAALRSSISVFDPALMPLSRTSSASPESPHRIPPSEVIIPENDPSVNQRRQNLRRVVEPLPVKIPHLTDDATPPRALHALQQRPRAAVLQDDVDARAIGMLQHVFVPRGVVGVVDGRNRRLWELLAHSLEFLVAGRAEDNFQAGRFGEFECEHGDAAGAWLDSVSGYWGFRLVMCMILWYRSLQSGSGIASYRYRKSQPQILTCE